MKTAIIYTTKYGCSQKCAKILRDKLGGEVDLYNLKTRNTIDLSQYQRIIIGGSIYMGRIQKEVRTFSIENQDRLKDKKLGLFICCMREGEEAQKQLEESFPQELIERAVAVEYFGGEFVFDKMSFMDSFIAKKVAKINKDTSNISEEKIYKFCEIFR